MGLTKTQEWISQSVPTIIPTLENEVVVDVAVGEHASFAVTENGKIYSWGLNQYGALGRNYNDETLIAGIPAPIDGLPPIQSVNVEEDSVMALDKNGGLWVWGYSKGSIIDGESLFDAVIKPHKVADLTELRDQYVEKYASKNGYDTNEIRDRWGQDGIDAFTTYFQWEWINPTVDARDISKQFHEWMESKYLTLDGGTIINGSTMLPLRKIFEGLGSDVTWDGDTQTITAVKIYSDAEVDWIKKMFPDSTFIPDSTFSPDQSNEFSRTIELQINSSTAIILGESTELRTPPQLVNNSTMVLYVLSVKPWALR